jgi:hypothetical protein
MMMIRYLLYCPTKELLRNSFRRRSSKVCHADIRCPLLFQIPDLVRIDQKYLLLWWSSCSSNFHQIFYPLRKDRHVEETEVAIEQPRTDHVISENLLPSPNQNIRDPRSAIRIGMKP